jgi:hypothetical protein
MNPYIEQPGVWMDFHQAFLVALREQLGAQVRPAFIVKLEEQVYIRELPEDEQRLLGRPDLSVMPGHSNAGTSPSDGGVAVAPMQARILPEVDVVKLSRLEIYDREGSELVAIIELLSPVNKRSGADREQYIAKRRGILHSPAHFIEIDLLRAYERMPLEGLPDCDYCVMVSRYEQRPQVDIWPLRLRDPLPKIPVPLRPPHPDASLDLMSALHHVYDTAGYADYIYRQQPLPPLHPADQQWAGELLGAEK